MVFTELLAPVEVCKVLASLLLCESAQHLTRSNILDGYWVVHVWPYLMKDLGLK